MSKIYSETDFMQLSLDEQLKCESFPQVGAIICKNGILLSTGYRGEVAGKHAERIAIEKLSSEDLKDSTLYTTLEPCVKLNESQVVEPCTDLIVKSGIKCVVIGILDPNGTVYSKGYEFLRKNNIQVNNFYKKYRDILEIKTFKVGDVTKIIGTCKRRIPVLQTPTLLNVFLSENSIQSINIRFQTIQYGTLVDLVSENGTIWIAAGVQLFSDITDPDIFRFPSHFARMNIGVIAIVNPPNKDFYILVKINEINSNDIIVQFEVRKRKNS